MQDKKGKKFNDKPAYGKKNNSSSSKPNGGKRPFSKINKPTPATPAAPKDPNTIRLNKYLSNAGICTRRESDIYIQSGNVKVNGKVVTELGTIVQITDEVQFDGVTVTPGKKEYILLNKPKNFTTSTDETSTNRSVLELIRGASKSVLQPVGRMDKNTTGLLLFTNDTDILTKFSTPNQKTSKLYQLTLDKNLKYEDLEKIKSGLTIDDFKVYVEEVSYIEGEPKSEIGIKMKTPNIKIVRTIFEHLNYNVLRVDRVAFANLTKKNLPRGHWRPLTSQEVINLKNSK